MEYDKYIDRQVERTRRAVKLVDLSQTFLVLLIGLAAVVLTAAVVEHWLVSDGVALWGRALLFVAIVGGCGYYLVRTLWPLLAQPINPAYAAQAIEREHPGLKNSLLNFLMFRTQKQQMPGAVYTALEEQAARRLSQTSIEDSIDRSSLIKLGYVLLAVVVATVAYGLLSPKSTLTTAARVLMPWANIAAPSRVRIEGIEPGSTEVVQGDSLEITANVFGLREGEQVALSYDTADGHRVDQRIEMDAKNDAGKFVCKLPAAGGVGSLTGIDQDLRYRIVAGDGRTIDYNIRVLTAPNIRIRRVYYDFPDYTGYMDRTVENRGDIRAIEGTKVTLYATANTDIEAAFLDLASDGKNDKRMRAEGSEAQVEIPLTLSDDRRNIKTTSYMLRYTSAEGLANNQPPQHAIEILPDYAPEVELLEPKQRMQDVQLNETVKIRVDARDPDFALRTVAIKLVKQDGAEVHQADLISSPHEGRFLGDWDFTPADHNLQPGDIVDYWAEAADIRAPQANRSTSVRNQFRIVGDPGDPKNGERNGGGQQGDPQQDQNGEGQGGEGEQQQGAEGGAEDGEGGEGQAGGGEAGESQDQESKGQGGESQGSEGQDSEGQGGAGGEQQNEQSQGGEGMQGDEQQAAGQEGGENGQQQTGEGQTSTGESQQDSSEGGAGGNQNGAGQNSNSDRQQNSEGASDGEPNEGGSGGENQDSRPVANDGSDDASAFEKISRQLSKEEQQNATRQQREGAAGDDAETQVSEGKGADDQRVEGQPEGSQRTESQPADNTQTSGSRKAAGEESGKNDGEEADDTTSEAADEAAGDADQQDAQQGDQANRQSEGGGADVQTDAPQSEGGPPSDSQADAESQSSGGEQRNASSDPGAGRDTKAEGSPDAQREMQQRDKTETSEEGSEKGEGEPPTPGHSKHESDSRGEEGGDRTGGGEEGGGQQAPREGTGSDGQNQAADKGAGQSADQGPGEAGQRGGDSQQAEGKTGESGQQQGDGSESRKGEGQAEQSQSSDSQQPNMDQNEGEPSEQQSEQSSQSKQDDSRQQSGAQQQNPNQQQEGAEQGGNQASSNSGQPGGNDGNAPGAPQGDFDGALAEGDEANLEYTRKQTDLVLDKLDDQLDKGDVDEQMLDELGWSEDDLRKFVNRWRKLRADAERPGAASAQEELDARLRSLGGSLGPKSGTTKRKQDDFRDLREGYQNKVPLKYRDRLKAYTEGVSRSRGEE